MQTWDAITSRRNVRSFADRPIPVAELDQILEAGRRAPSSQNWQPWDFIVVTDQGQLRELAKVDATIGGLIREALGHPSGALAGACDRAGQFLRGWWGEPPSPPYAPEG